MRLSSLLVLLVLASLLAAVSPASALMLPAAPHVPASIAAAAEEEDEVEEAEDEDESEAEAEGGDGSEAEEGEPEEPEACEPEEGEACEEEDGDEVECVLESASAGVAVNPRGGKVRLTVRYRASSPAAVAIDARLRGPKGGLHLDATRARFRRAGVFHDSFGLGKRQMAKALAARELTVDLRAENTPGPCGLRLSAHRVGARKFRSS